MTDRYGNISTYSPTNVSGLFKRIASGEIHEDYTRKLDQIFRIIDENGQVDPQSYERLERSLQKKSLHLEAQILEVVDILLKDLDVRVLGCDLRTASRTKIHFPTALLILLIKDLQDGKNVGIMTRSNYVSEDRKTNLVLQLDCHSTYESPKKKSLTITISNENVYYKKAMIWIPEIPETLYISLKGKRVGEIIQSDYLPNSIIRSVGLPNLDKIVLHLKECEHWVNIKHALLTMGI